MISTGLGNMIVPPSALTIVSCTTEIAGTRDTIPYATTFTFTFSAPLSSAPECAMFGNYPGSDGPYEIISWQQYSPSIWIATTGQINFTEEFPITYQWGEVIGEVTVI